MADELGPGQIIIICDGVQYWVTCHHTSIAFGASKLIWLFYSQARGGLTNAGNMEAPLPVYNIYKFINSEVYTSKYPLIHTLQLPYP
jgi:hypothetical protein